MPLEPPTHRRDWDTLPPEIQQRLLEDYRDTVNTAAPFQLAVSAAQARRDRRYARIARTIWFVLGTLIVVSCGIGVLELSGHPVFPTDNPNALTNTDPSVLEPWEPVNVPPPALRIDAGSASFAAGRELGSRWLLEGNVGNLPAISLIQTPVASPTYKIVASQEAKEAIVGICHALDQSWQPPRTGNHHQFLHGCVISLTYANPGDWNGSPVCAETPQPGPAIVGLAGYGICGSGNDTIRVLHFGSAAAMQAFLQPCLAPVLPDPGWFSGIEGYWTSTDFVRVLSGQDMAFVPWHSEDAAAREAVQAHGFGLHCTHSADDTKWYYSELWSWHVTGVSGF